MLKSLFYSKHMLWCCRLFFSLFYKQEYLKGKYFEEKRMGWLWAFLGLPSKILGKHRNIPWPVGKNTLVSNGYNLLFDNSSINVFQMPGCYFQCHDAKITIGKNAQIAPNCGIITTNHNIYNPNEHIQGKDVVIGDNCWVGMNSVILPGVVLGDHTVVGAGSVVTKSYSEGYVVIAGVPAKVIHKLDKSNFI
ncbi:acyltransferase [Bacillus sp. JJ1609]|uniref:acyltransferase n=1 Tax=Bacillus sp. JJ1609 TaxID=3122977 RepID=UPI002FFEC54F